MSSHGRDKHNGSGLSPGNKASAPPPRQRKEGLRADFLLNFQRPPAHQRPQAYAPPPRRTRPSGRQQYAPEAFSKGRFVQSAFRVYVDEITPDVAEAALNADTLLKWESVCRVDLLCKDLPKCPICLEVDLIVPKITRCGHVFCAPCVMRYFMTLTDYNGKKYQRCPVCNEQVCPEELKSTRFEESKALRPNDRCTFVLAHRDTGSTIVRLSEAAAAAAQPPPLPEDERQRTSGSAAPSSRAAAAPGGSDPLHLPSRGERGWHFSRLVRLRPGEAAQLLDYEVEALESFRMVASSEGDKEVLPSIDAALALSRRRQRGRTGSGASPGPALAAAAGGDGAPAEDLLLPEPAVDLPEEVEDDAASASELEEVAEPGVGTPASGPCSASPAAGPSSSSPYLGAGSSSSPGLAAASPAYEPGGGRQKVSFYQAADGRQVFFEPFFTKLLLHEHGGRWDGLPPVLEELRVEKLQEMSISEDTRRRHKFMQHLPLGSVVLLAEVDLRNHLGPDTKNYFAEEFSKRRQQRKKDQIRSRKEERLCKSRAAEEEERYYQALNLPHTHIPVQQVPTKEDFVPLTGNSRPSQAEEGEDEEGANAAGEGDGEGSEAAEEDEGPTLADKIKGSMAKKAPSRASAARAPDLGAKAFPGLGGGPAGRASGSSAGAAAGSSEAATASRGTGKSCAWGAGRGSSRVKKEGTDGPGADEAAAAPSQSSGIPDAWDEPTFGEALEAALKSAEADQPNAESSAGGGAAGKKKKGRAGKATTIRLFG